MFQSDAIKTKLEKLQESDKYWISNAKLDFSLAIESIRRMNNKSYTDIAKAMGKSNAYISKVFRGDANLTIESMVKLTRALGCQISIQASDNILFEINRLDFCKSTPAYTSHKDIDAIEAVKSYGHTLTTTSDKINKYSDNSSANDSAYLQAA